MNSEVRECQNCKNQFSFSKGDLDLFDKLRVSIPVICKKCAIKQMMTLRNDRVLYSRVCDKCGKKSLSLYHPAAPYVVYCHDCWWSDNWDSSEYGADYNPNRPFFDQFLDLQKRVPRESLLILNSENSGYGNNVRDSRDIYFGFQIANCENVLHSVWMVGVKDSVLSHKILNSELIAYGFNLSKCYRSVYLKDSNDCSDCYFSFDLQGCSNCLFSSNLRNKSYHIFNKPVSKEIFEAELSKVINGSYKDFLSAESKFQELKKRSLYRYSQAFKSFNANGNYLQECNNVNWCFFAVNCENIVGAANILNTKDLSYCYAVGPQVGQLFYGSAVLKGGFRCFSSFNLVNCKECFLSDSLVSSSNCIGCVGLRNGEYSILNKKYLKEEYQAIEKTLREKGELLDFPLKSFSTFAYNESAAQDIYPLSKEEAISEGYQWQDDLQLTSGKETLLPDLIPDKIEEIPESITKEILKCIDCGRNYVVAAQEAVYYKKLQIPLPRECPQCRIAKQILQKPPFFLWHRQCQCAGTKSENGVYQNMANHQHGIGKCLNEFETSYAPERPEIVYCESCYNSEVV